MVTYELEISYVYNMFDTHLKKLSYSFLVEDVLTDLEIRDRAEMALKERIGIAQVIIDIDCRIIV